MRELFKPELYTYLFLFFTGLWWLEFFLFNSENRNRKSKSFLFILIAIIFSILLALFFFIIDFINLTGKQALFLRNLGVVVYGTGLVIRYWSLIVLGKYFTRDVQVEQGQALVKKGPYAVLRHPSYTGLLLLSIGVYLYIANIPGIVLGIGVIFSALYFRIREEEREMEKVLGNRYTVWKKKRYRLLPWIY